MKWVSGIYGKILRGQNWSYRRKIFPIVTFLSQVPYVVGWDWTWACRCRIYDRQSDIRAARDLYHSGSNDRVSNFTRNIDIYFKLPRWKEKNFRFTIQRRLGPILSFRLKKKEPYLWDALTCRYSHLRMLFLTPTNGHGFRNEFGSLVNPRQMFMSGTALPA
jgi:hypothetical protein